MTTEPRLMAMDRAILTATRRILADEAAWTQRTDARNAKGEPTSALAPAACQWCLYGALLKAAAATPRPKKVSICVAVNRAIQWLEDAGVSRGHITLWNDNPNRAHASVLRVLNTALEMAAPR